MLDVIDSAGRPDGAGYRIAIVSDAWKPQINGVVRTLDTVAGELRAMGHAVEVFGPDRFRTIPCPTYPDIRLSLFPRRRLAALLRDFRPDALHIATEGPLGMAARGWARRHGRRFTTSFHTLFPEYIHARIGLPTALSYAWMRRFHAPAATTMVATASLRSALAARGFGPLSAWSRGVDLARFRPEPRRDWAGEGLAGPVFAYVGRVAVEKNIEAFLDLDLPGSKVVVGGGPQLAALQAKYPGVTFTGPLADDALAAAYAGADVFVFPSKTDTFGLVVLESLACGTPVASYDVPGPADTLSQARDHVGAYRDDLREACLAALTADRAACRRFAETYSWRACAQTFLGLLTYAEPPSETGTVSSSDVAKRGALA